MPLPLEINSTRPSLAKPAVRYRALSPLAVASVALGVLSIANWLTWYAFFIPLAGVAFGWQALRRIRRAPDEWTGVELAWIGIVASLALWGGGCVRLILVGASEIPYGYTLVNYEALQADPQKPTEPIPQSALDMQDKKVFMRGYMQPRRAQTGIKEFILCPTKGDCPFCTPDPKRTEMIRVSLQGDLETIFTNHEIGVAGRFRVDPEDPSRIPYGLEADCPIR
jgi:hypothetical protein